MSFSEQCFVQTFVNDYFDMIFTLKQQSYLAAAIYICHNVKFRNCIFSPALEITDTSSPYEVREKWEKFFKMHSAEVCKTLNLILDIEQELIYFIRWVALHLIIWSGEWKREFDIPCDFTSVLWMPSDWIGGRLNEVKIAARLMEDDRLTVDQRYKLACNYCIIEYIHPLWNELPLAMKNFYVKFNLPYSPIPSLVHIWSRSISVPESYANANEFLRAIFLSAAENGPMSAIIFSWNNMNEKPSSAEMYNQALWVLSKIGTFQNLPFMNNLSIFLPSSVTKGDLYCFLLTKVHDESIEMIATAKHVTQSFMEWPSKPFCRVGS